MRYYITILVTFVMCGYTSANDRTLAEMKEAALNVLNSKSPSQHRTSTLDLTDLKELKRMDKLSIIGSEDGGFAVISHDDSFDAILGYSFTSLTDADTLPCGFEWWLEAANESMNNPTTNLRRSVTVRRSNAYPSSVAPLLTTKWNQKVPYNNKCIAHVNGKEYRCLTGCVATAMAQVMYYYKHPERGMGSNSYSVSYSGWGEVEYSANFDNSIYDWDNMLNDYNNGYNSSQADAVAVLMHDCGVAVNMVYGTGSSSASYSDVQTALKRYFSYKYANYMERLNYSDEEWLDMMYNELSHGRPLLYEGSKSEWAAHAFIIHGYNADGLFYVNWGWGGNQDGFFDLNVLNGYSEYQGMVVVSKDLPEGYIEKRTVTLSQAGTLSSYISEGDKYKIAELKIKGKINGTDILFIREMAGQGAEFGRQTNGILASLDLSEATIISGGEAYYSNFTTSNNVFGKYIFSRCKNLSSIILPNNLVSIEEEAFSGCSGLTKIEIPENVNYINERAFSACDELCELSVSPNNKIFDSRENCNGIIKTAENELVLASYKTQMPYSITKIGNRAFSCCGRVRLKSVNLPNKIIYIGDAAFADCYNLKTIKMSDNITYIGKKAFYSCGSLTTIDIPKNVENLSDYVFHGCDKINSITIPNGVTSIGQYAFDGCRSLTSVSIPNSVTSIGRTAFYGCSGLTTLTIGSGIKTISEYAFENCPNLSEVYCYAENVPNTGTNAFDNSNPEYATLHVSEASLNAYKTTAPWSKFGTFKGLDGSSIKKCATPSISYADKKLTFDCETEGVEFVYDITDTDIKHGNDAEVSLTATYEISVYATKAGYENSDVATATLVWSNASFTETTPATAIAPAAEMEAPVPVLIQNNGGMLTVQGAQDGTPVSVYTTAGTEAGSAVSQNSMARINTNMQQGDIAIIRIGNRSVKVVIK